MLNPYMKERIINHCKSVGCFALLLVVVVVPWLIGWQRILVWVLW